MNANAKPIPTRKQLDEALAAVKALGVTPTDLVAYGLCHVALEMLENFDDEETQEILKSGGDPTDRIRQTLETMCEMGAPDEGLQQYERADEIAAVFAPIDPTQMTCAQIGEALLRRGYLDSTPSAAKYAGEHRAVTRDLGATTTWVYDCHWMAVDGSGEEIDGKVWVTRNAEGELVAEF